MKSWIAAIAIVLSGLGQSAAAQDYLPIDPGPSPLLGGASPFASTASDQAAAATEVRSLAALKCATPPTAASLSTGQFKQTTLDRSAAVEAGLPIGNQSSNIAKKVLVQDWIRTAKCIATDGKTELIYGQGIRLVAHSDGLTADGDVTLGMLAANATLNNQTSSVQIDVLGFNDNQLNTLAAQIFGPINVERFASVDDLTKKMVQRANALSGGSVVKLGIAFQPTSARDLAIGAFALQQIADGRSCEATKSRFSDLGASQSALITSTYTEMEASCDGTPTGGVSQARARDALGKIRVRM